MIDLTLPEGRAKRLNRLLAQYLIPVGFALYVLANFLPLPGKFEKNLFYGLCALPALIWGLVNRPQLRRLLHAYALLWLFLLAMGLSSLLHTPALAFKPVLYIALLLLALHICWGENGRMPERLFAWLALLALLALLWSSLQWFWQLHSTGLVQRFLLWGRLHPLRTALLIGCGLAWLWTFVLEPRLRHYAVWWRALGFGAVMLLMMWTAVIFQARSLLTGMAGFLALAMFTRRADWSALLVLMALLGLADALGWFATLSERGLSYRQDIWLDGWTRLNTACGLLSGCGEDGYKLMGLFDHVHSAYWSILYVHGLPTFLLFVCCAGWLVLQGLRYRSRWLLVATIGWGGVLTTTGGVVHAPAEYWIYFWMPTLLAMFECRQAVLIQTPRIDGETRRES